MLSKRCCRSGKRHPGSDAMRWKGKADTAPGFPACRLHNRCPCATWEAFNVANNTERVASFQKWVAALIKKGSRFSPPSPCAFRRHTKPPSPGADEQTLSPLSRKPVCSQLQNWKAWARPQQCLLPTPSDGACHLFPTRDAGGPSIDRSQPGGRCTSCRNRSIKKTSSST